MDHVAVQEELRGQDRRDPQSYAKRTYDRAATSRRRHSGIRPPAVPSSAAQGSWTRWATDLIKWNVHCTRNRNEASWIPKFAEIVTTQDLRRKRAAFCIRSANWNCDAARTNTRARTGFVVCFGCVLRVYTSRAGFPRELPPLAEAPGLTRDSCQAGPRLPRFFFSFSYICLTAPCAASFVKAGGTERGQGSQKPRSVARSIVFN